MRPVQEGRSHRRCSPMLREDFIIQTNVRRILIRSNIDYSEIAFGTVKGVVYLQGVFKLSRLDANSGDTRDLITTRTLRSLEMKIKGIPGVVDVKFQLLNWKKDKGQWTVATPTE
jgi:hypothetical protein